MYKEIKFEGNDISILHLLSILRNKKDEIEENNSLIVVSKKYMKELLKSHSYNEKNGIIYLSTKSLSQDYHYTVSFQECTLDSAIAYKLISVETNDYEYKDVFMVPDQEKEINALYFEKQGMDLFKKR